MSNKPRDIHGQEVVVADPYWVITDTSSTPAVGRFVMSAASTSGEPAGFVLYEIKYTFEEMKGWQFQRAIPPSFDAQSSPPPAGTVRVRIPVGVTVEGVWESGNVFGGPGQVYGLRFQTVERDLRKRTYESVLYVEANLPIPAPTTVEGSVSQ